jgi:hypothetical protein
MMARRDTRRESNVADVCAMYGTRTDAGTDDTTIMRTMLSSLARREMIGLRG